MGRRRAHDGRRRQRAGSRPAPERLASPGDGGADSDRWPAGPEDPGGRRLHVILTAHAERQLDELGRPARRVLEYLHEISHDEISWSAERMPSQHGREVWLLWAGSVRVLFDIEDDDLTVQGFGLRPRW